MIRIDAHQDNPPTFLFKEAQDHHWLTIESNEYNIAIHLGKGQVDLTKERMIEAANA